MKFRIAININYPKKSFIADNPKHRKCEICLNSVKCQLVELHHIDHNNKNNIRSNVQWLCWFCHHHGWHGDPFDDLNMLWGWYDSTKSTNYLYAYDRNEKNKRILTITGNDFYNLMTSPVDKYEQWLRFALQSEIAVWSYKFVNSNRHMLSERYSCCSDESIMKKIRTESFIEANTIRIKSKMGLEA